MRVDPAVQGPSGWREPLDPVVQMQHQWERTNLELAAADLFAGYVRVARDLDTPYVLVRVVCGARLARASIAFNIGINNKANAC